MHVVLIIFLIAVNKFLHKKQLKRKNSLAYSSRDTIHHGGEGLVAGMGGEW